MVTTAQEAGGVSIPEVVWEWLLGDPAGAKGLDEISQEMPASLSHPAVGWAGMCVWCEAKAVLLSPVRGAGGQDVSLCSVILEKNQTSPAGCMSAPVRFHLHMCLLS